MIVHAPMQKKIKTATGQQGNVLTRSFLMEYNGASEQTQIITPADTGRLISRLARVVLMSVSAVKILISMVKPHFWGWFLVSKNGSQCVVKRVLATLPGFVLNYCLIRLSPLTRSR